MVPQMIQCLLEQARDMLVVEGIVDELAVAAGAQHPQIAQEAQLVRNGGVGHAQERGEIADA